MAKDKEAKNTADGWQFEGQSLAGYRLGYSHSGEDAYFVIARKVAGDELPAGDGSHKAGKKELLEDARFHMDMLRLFEAADKDAFFTFSGELLSDRVLEAMHKDGAFKPTPYNKYKPEDDYRFLLRMNYKKKTKNQITGKQQDKIAALLATVVKPYLERKLLEGAGS